MSLRERPIHRYSCLVRIPGSAIAHRYYYEDYNSQGAREAIRQQVINAFSQIDSRKIKVSKATRV